MYFDRQIANKLRKYYERPEIVVLPGARQVGKTTLLHILRKEIDQKKEGQSHYFDMEEIMLRDICNRGPENFLFNYPQLKDGHRHFLFIDEVQTLDDPSNFLKILHDHYPDLKLFVSGSSSLEMMGKFRDSLAGRKVVFHIYPLSFYEFLVFKGRDDLISFLDRWLIPNDFGSLNGFPFRDIKFQAIRTEMNAFWQEYTHYGALPGVVKESDPEIKHEILKDVFQSYLLKDIQFFARIDNVSGYNRLIRVLAGQIGGLLNFAELSRVVRLDIRTLERYMTILENSFIISMIQPFYRNPAVEVIKSPKLYFVDIGLRNYILGLLSIKSEAREQGVRTENCVMMSLPKRGVQRDNIHFWRTRSKAEVDIIWEQRNQVVPMEIKSQISLRSPLPSGLRSFILKYQPDFAFLLGDGTVHQKDLGNTKVVYYPYWMF